MEKSVTEYQILFTMTSGKDDFYTEDENEYNEYFQELQDNGELDTIEQCIRKDYIWNDETEDWEEDWVEILYDGLTEDYIHTPQKLETKNIVSTEYIVDTYNTEMTGGNVYTVLGKFKNGNYFCAGNGVMTISDIDQEPYILGDLAGELLPDENKILELDPFNNSKDITLYLDILGQTDYFDYEPSELDELEATIKNSSKTESVENNTEIDIKPLGKPQCDYTGGGIWLAFMKVEIDNKEYYITLSSEDEDDENNGGEFSVYTDKELNELAVNINKGVFVFDNNSKYMPLYKQLKTVLKKAMKTQIPILENKKYIVTALAGSDGVYNSYKVGEYDTVDQATDKVAELNAEGFNASYEEVEDNGELEIVSINSTDGGYANNATTLYGKLSDGTYFVYYTEMDLVETYSAQPDELIELLYYNTTHEEKMSEEEYQEKYNDFFEQYNVNTYGPGDDLYEKLRDMWINDTYETLTEDKKASSYEIEYVEPDYTGGGIYVYTGKLKDGNYFIADDTYFQIEGNTFEPYMVRIVDINPDKIYTDEVGNEYTLLDDVDLQEQHLVTDLIEDDAREFTIKLLQWVVDNKPQSNYNMGDIKEDLENIKSIKTESKNEARKYNVSLIPNNLYKVLLNIQDMYQEDLWNSEDDVFAGTEDSYAVETLYDHLADIIETPEYREYRNKNYNVKNPDKIDMKLDNDLINAFGAIIRDERLEEFRLQETKKVEAKAVGKDKSDFKRMLKTFDNNGKYAKRGNWEIARGGYDLWYEISYDKVPVIGCVAGKVSAYQKEFEEYAKLVSEEYGDTYVDTLTEGKVTTTSGTYDTDKYDEICNNVKQAYKDAWSGKISYSDLEDIKKNSGLSSGELSSVQYMASRETDKKEETKKYSINNNTKFISYEPEMEGTYTLQDMKDTYNNKVSDEYKREGSSFENWLDDMLKSGVYEIEEAKSIDTLETQLQDKINKVLQKPEYGFDQKDIKDYVVIELNKLNEEELKVEIRIELDYDLSMKLIDELNPIIQKYDKEAYFDMEEPGIMTAIIQTKKNKVIENKIVEEVDKEEVQEEIEQEKQETGIKDDIDTEEEAKTATKKELYQYAKQQGLDLEKLRKQGIELSEVADTLDKVIGNMVSKSIIEYEDKTGKSVVWDFEVKNNDIEIVISEI